jgi:DNA polymerase-4
MIAIRKIVHIDMDAFFAAIEQRDNPDYRGKPIIVGGRPDSRGVVATASYEARRFGIHSAMPSSQARRLCPNAIFVRPHFDVYGKVSRQIMNILREYTDLVEPASLDEAYLDVTECKKEVTSATLIAKEIKGRIFDSTELTASAGVAPNKFLAKIASDMNKPDGLTVIPPKRVRDFLGSLPVGKVPGIGKVTESRMHNIGLFTLEDIQQKTKGELVAQFGKAGNWFYEIARGIDRREVAPERVTKSVGCEDTFAYDLHDLSEMDSELSELAGRLAERLGKRDYRGRTITLKVTYGDFKKITRSSTQDEYVNDKATLQNVAVSLLRNTEASERPVRLLGISVSNFEHVEKNKAASSQLSFPFHARRSDSYF